MVDAGYVRILRRAYFLEVLGEAVYRQGSQSERGTSVSGRWQAFADTEARMQLLLRKELRRILGRWEPSRPATHLVNRLGQVAGLLSSTLLGLMINRVLARRRYARWAAEVNSENPRLWKALVEHERRQVDHFQGRGR